MLFFICLNTCTISIILNRFYMQREFDAHAHFSSKDMNIKSTLYNIACPDLWPFHRKSTYRCNASVVFAVTSYDGNDQLSNNITITAWRTQWSKDIHSYSWHRFHVWRTKIVALITARTVGTYWHLAHRRTSFERTCAMLLIILLVLETIFTCFKAFICSFHIRMSMLKLVTFLN